MVVLFLAILRKFQSNCATLYSEQKCVGYFIIGAILGETFTGSLLDHKRKNAFVCDHLNSDTYLSFVHIAHHFCDSKYFVYIIVFRDPQIISLAI